MKHWYLEGCPVSKVKTAMFEPMGKSPWKSFTKWHVRFFFNRFIITLDKGLSGDVSTQEFTILSDGEFHKWMFFYGKTIYRWMIWGYPHFMKPPYLSKGRPLLGLQDSNKKMNRSSIHTYLHALIIIDNTRNTTTCHAKQNNCFALDEMTLHNACTVPVYLPAICIYI